MRIGIAVEGTRGDVAPMLLLGAALAARGHRVSIACPPGFRAAARDHGISFLAATADVHRWLPANAPALGAGGLRTVLAFDRFSREHAELHFEAAEVLARDSDQLIAAGVQLGAASAAERFGIPYRYVAFCPALFPSADYPPFPLPWQRMPRWLNRLAWRLYLPLFALPLARLVNRARGARAMPPIRDALTHLLGERPVLAADARLAPLPDDVAFETQSIAALHPMRGEPLPDKVRAFLDAGPAPVYLGFGSMTDTDPQRTTRQLLEAIESAGCRALLASGWAGLGDAPLPSHVMRLGTLSHAELFPRCAVVVHHGGAGTTTTAARAGVPQIVVPHLLDQYYWGNRVHLLGLGPAPLPRARLAAASIAEALRGTLDNELLAERAAALGAQLRCEFETRFRPEALLEDPGV